MAPWLDGLVGNLVARQIIILLSKLEEQIKFPQGEYVLMIIKMINELQIDDFLTMTRESLNFLF